MSCPASLMTPWNPSMGACDGLHPACIQHPRSGKPWMAKQGWKNPTKYNISCYHSALLRGWFVVGPAKPLLHSCLAVLFTCARWVSTSGYDEFPLPPVLYFWFYMFSLRYLISPFSAWSSMFVERAMPRFDDKPLTNCQWWAVLGVFHFRKSHGSKLGVSHGWFIRVIW
jgi:hypothetical protein